jgi:hypothetical protein
MSTHRQESVIDFPTHLGTVIEPTTTDFPSSQRMLAMWNRGRLEPGLGEPDGYCRTAYSQRMALLEDVFVQKSREGVAPLLANVPSTAKEFVRWFEGLKFCGPGQGDPLFPWLAEKAGLEDMRWFLQQEVAGEAGFDDLLALTQVKMPIGPKLEMARNYWDEMGRGAEKATHGPLLSRLADHLDLAPTIETTEPEPLALGNLMVALAVNRRFAFQSVGALGVIELTAPTRAVYVVDALDRLGISKKESHYFALHAVLDVKHSQAWNAEVLEPLVAEDPRRAKAIAEGALLRLAAGKACFERYRAHFNIK